ncbi:MAG: bifunctional homocysteine S-methyltransferase/methylenetetrahydrofolate reductase [Bdellovibrionales bacterium]|nr:bifunctional homocysteine S-methyltransferase/methylenetetrahydrofolate reductase [Bdellovibrionales bacterium]
MEKISLIEKLNDKKPLICDGSLATSLYQKGFYINRSFEELSLLEPNSVSEVTNAFYSSGAQLISTNTFNAIQSKLVEYGLQDQLEEIIKASCEIACDLAGSDAYVMGTMGPLGLIMEPLGPTSFDDAKSIFLRSAQALAQNKIDAFQLLSFHDLTELKACLEACRQVSSLPIMATIALQESFKTSFGHTLQEFVDLAHQYNIEIVGICGEIGPSTMLTALNRLRPLTKKPICLKPNAGFPRYVNDEYIYLCNPDYLGKYAKRFVQAGANIVGGHSGVYEGHIKAIANALRMAKTSEVLEGNLPENIQPICDEPKKPLPLSERSRLGEFLFKNKSVVSVEIIPPKGVDASEFLNRVQQLEDAGVEFVNIPDGARAVSRMSSLQLSIYIKQNFKIEPIPHLTSRDRNLLGLQGDLLGCHVNGVRNVLLITGDPPKLGNVPGATAVYDVDSIGMTHILSRMNKGLDLGGSTFGDPTEFVFGVALNPTASNQELEIKRFKYKVDAGAEYAITQPIYSVEAYERFIEKLGGVDIPIIMGVWPLVSLRNAEFLKHEVPGVEVPDWVIEEMEKAGDSKEEAIRRGLDIGQRIIEDAKGMVSGFQVSAPFNKVEIAIELLKSTKLI